MPMLIRDFVLSSAAGRVTTETVLATPWRTMPRSTRSPGVSARIAATSSSAFATSCPLTDFRTSLLRSGVGLLLLVDDVPRDQGGVLLGPAEQRADQVEAIGRLVHVDRDHPEL